MSDPVQMLAVLVAFSLCAAAVFAQDGSQAVIECQMSFDLACEADPSTCCSSFPGLDSCLRSATAGGDVVLRSLAHIVYMSSKTRAGCTQEQVTTCIFRSLMIRAD